jgi:tetratricopeptide (TPR) repeat protein
LYELLTGRPPFKTAGFLETLEQVRSQDPLPPSRLHPGLPRDVQTICLKCLEKEPRRRYESAAALAADLRRFLRNEPIAARPVSTWERVAKWSRRKPAAAALFGLSCVAGMALVAGVLMHNARLRVEVQRAARSEDEANKQSRRADANYREARETLNGILNRFDDRRLLDVPRLKELRQDVLEKSLAFYEGVLKDTDNANPAVRFDAAVALEQTGHIQAALSRPREAEENMRRAVALFDALAAERPGDAETNSHLADCLGQLGLLCRARAGPGVDAVKESLSSDERATLDEAESYLRRALQLREALRDAQSHQPRWREELAGTHRDLVGICQSARKPELAIEHARTAMAIRSELFASDPANRRYTAALAESQVHLGRILVGRESLDQVESHFAEAAARLEALARDDEHAPETEYSVLLAQLYLTWGHLLRAHHQRDDKALDLYGKAIRLMEAVLEREPRDAQAKLTLHNAHGGRAYLHEQLKRYPDSLQDWDRVLALSDGPDRAFNRSCRTITLARSGAHVETAAEARQLVADPAGIDDVVFNACLAYSIAYQAAQHDARLAPDSRRTAAESYAVDALAALHQLRARGYFENPEYVFLLRTDPDLVFLRGRDDYQKLLDGVFNALSESDRHAVMAKAQP